MSNNELVIIPKIEKYIEYMLTILIRLPRTEKFSIGTEIKTSMYEMLKYILLSSKVEKSICASRVKSNVCMLLLNYN